MTDADPARPASGARPGGELALRVVSTVVLAPLAIGVAYLGGWAFAVFWGIAALLVLWEWTALIVGGDRRSVLMTGAAAVLIAIALAGLTHAADGIHAVRLL